MASLRLVLTFEDKAPLIVALSGIDSAMLGRLFDWLGLVVVPIVAFLDALLTLCANTPEPTDAVNSIACSTNNCSIH